MYFNLGPYGMGIRAGVVLEKDRVKIWVSRDDYEFERPFCKLADMRARDLNIWYLNETAMVERRGDHFVKWRTCARVI